MKEKKWNPGLWKPLGVRPVNVPEYIKPGKLNSFLDYQAPNDRYEVRGIMPSSKNETIITEKEEVKRKVRRIED